MAKAICDVEEIELLGFYSGDPVPGIKAQCRRCGHEIESYGTSDKSIRRCLVMMRKECPKGETNFYARGDK